MNILNSSEAFSAMMAGKNIMCRAVGELIEFDDLNQFPATIFAQPGYEFCIKRETLTLAEIQFTKPVEPHDLESGQEIYIVMPTCILRTQYDHEHGDICLSVANGFAQLDVENAKLQLQAFGKTFGNMITEIEVKDGFNDKPKKTRASRKKAEEKIEEPMTADASIASVEVESISKRPAFTIDDVAEVETDPNAIIEKFTTQIANCTTTNAALELRYSFSANGHLNDTHVHHLIGLVESKCLELDPEQYTPKVDVETVDQEEVTVPENTPADDYFLIKGDAEKSRISSEIKQELTYKIAQMNTQELDEISIEIHNNPELVSTHKNHLDGHIELRRKALAKEADAKYQELLNNLIDRAANAQTPAEATALTGYTKSWTEEQRKPLIDAIHKRLNELNVDAQPIETPPSLMAQIQNAPDLTALDVLEIDVGGRHPDIQSKLMGFIKRRRFELENGAAQ